MQPTTLAAYLKLGAAAAIVGGLAAGAISLAMPRRYVSTAVMRFAPPAVAGKPAWQIEADAARRLREMWAEILGRSSLTEIIQRPAMDLYRQERAREPMEDVIQEMRKRDLRIEPLPPRDFRVSFEYPDLVKAQAVVRELTTRLGAGGIAEVVTPASLPEKPSQLDWLAIVGIGFGVGLVLGFLSVLLRRRGLKWTLGMAGCTVAGCALAVTVWLLMPDTFADHRKSYQLLALGAFTGLVVGAFLLRARGSGGNQYARRIAFTAACGAVAGGFVSFAIPERYVSTATMRAFPFSDGGAGAADLEIEPAERLQQLADEILSRGSLAELIQRPSLVDLYREERQRVPMEDIIDYMRRRDIRIAPRPPTGDTDLADLGPGTSFQISFEYPDRDKAETVVRQLVTKYLERNFLANRALPGVTPDRDPPRDQMAGSLAFNDAAGAKPDSGLIPGVPLLEMLDAASLPESPISPNRPAAAAIGLLAGTLLGSLLALGRWLAARRAATPGPHAPYGKYTLVAAAIGAIAFGLLSFLSQDLYVSAALLRVVPFPAGGARMAQGASEYTARLRHLTEDILSRGSLAELIQRPSLDLYRRERPAQPLEDIIDNMRHRHLWIGPAPPFGLAGPGHLTSFEILFEYPDRHKAQALVQALVTQFTDGAAAAERALHRDRTPGSLTLEVLDPASLPGSPVAHNRLQVAAVGLVAGMLLGPPLAWRRQRRAKRQAAGLGPSPSYWKYALPAAIVGAFLVSFSYAFYFTIISNRYVSTAVLRLVSADPRSPDSVQAAAEHMPELFQQVLSRNSLAGIIQEPNLELYTQERARSSLDEVIKQMREQDLHVGPVRLPFDGLPTAFRISFEYSDWAKARSCVQAVAGKFLEALPPPHRDTLPSPALPWPSDGPGRLLPSAEQLGRPTAKALGFPQRDATGQAVAGKFVEALPPPQRNPLPSPPPQRNLLPSPALHWPSDGPGRLLPSAAGQFGGPAAMFGFPQRAATGLLANQLEEGGGDTQGRAYASYLEVLDLADVNEAPLYLARWGPLAALGGLAGMLLGIAIARARRPNPHSAPA